MKNNGSVSGIQLEANICKKKEWEGEKGHATSKAGAGYTVKYFPYLCLFNLNRILLKTIPKTILKLELSNFAAFM